MDHRSLPERRLNAVFVTFRNQTDVVTGTVPFVDEKLKAWRGVFPQRMRLPGHVTRTERQILPEAPK